MGSDQHSASRTVCLAVLERGQSELGDLALCVFDFYLGGRKFGRNQRRTGKISSVNLADECTCFVFETPLEGLSGGKRW